MCMYPQRVGVTQFSVPVKCVYAYTLGDEFRQGCRRRVRTSGVHLPKATAG